MTQYNQLNLSYDNEECNNTICRYDMKKNLTVLYREWMNTVSKIVYMKIHIHLDDLPDENYRINFDQDMTAEDMAKIVLRTYYYSELIF